MFLVKSSNKCSISWTELEFFTLSTTSSSGTISLQFFLQLHVMFVVCVTSLNHQQSGALNVMNVFVLNVKNTIALPEQINSDDEGR
jgi:hypothetical protein